MVLFKSSDRELALLVIPMAEKLVQTAGGKFTSLDLPNGERSIHLNDVSPFDTDSSMEEVLKLAVEDYAKIFGMYLKAVRGK